MASPVTVCATRIALSCLLPAATGLAGDLPQNPGARLGEATAVRYDDPAAVLVAATLAESQGRHAEAERLLRGLLGSANGTIAAAARTRLDALLMRQGRAPEFESIDAGSTAAGATPAAGQDPAADPITRLIQKLDAGTRDNPDVKSAIEQLDDLDSLIVPNLLAVLPDFGPFGIYNALILLRSERDERIATTLGAMLESGKPEVVAAITGYLGRLHPTVAVPLARKVATMDVGPTALRSALAVLLEDGRNDDVARALTQRMLRADDVAMQRGLLFGISDAEREWFDLLFDELRQSADMDVRAAATFQHIEAAGLDEDEALAQLAGIESSELPWRVAALGAEHPDWVRVAVLGLRRTPDDSRWDSTKRDIIDRFEWWRAPEVALPALLALPMTQNDVGSNSPEYGALQAFAPFLSRVAATDWVLPQEYDEPLAERITQTRADWRAFVEMLPTDGESRALAVWRTAPDERHGLAHAVAGLRPWHDLASEVLLHVGPKLSNAVASVLRMDWRGASAPAQERLAQFARRAANLPSGMGGNSAQQVIQVYRDTPGLTVDVIMPMIEANVRNGNPFQALCEREPRAALDYAVSGDLHGDYHAMLRDVLISHGTAEDLPVALRVVRESYLQQQNPRALEQWFATQAPGHLDVVRLGQPDTLMRARSEHLALTLALSAAERIQSADFVAALQLIPAVVPEVRGALQDALRPLVVPEHVEPLRAAVTASLGGELITYRRHQADHYVLQALVEMLGSTGHSAALPELRAVLTRTDLGKSITKAAAMAIVATAGEERGRAFTELLASDRDVVVQAALLAFGAPEASDPTMVDRAIAAIRRHGATLESVGNLFAPMARPERVRAAEAILLSEAMRDFEHDVVRAAIDQLADNRDVSHVPTLALAATHRDYKIRLEASKQLGNSFDRSAVPHLLELLRDEDSEVRSTAQSGLDQIANYLDEYAKWQKRFGDLPAKGKGKDE